MAAGFDDRSTKNSKRAAHNPMDRSGIVLLKLLDTESESRIQLDRINRPLTETLGTKRVSFSKSFAIMGDSSEIPVFYTSIVLLSSTDYERML